MNEREGECIFFHRNCPSGCNRVDCRARFPKEVKVIMESHKTICLSPEYKECDRYIEGLKFREERRLSKVGCQFLSDKICGRPNEVWCKGHVPPFRIDVDNFLESCYGKDVGDCPNYKMGVAFAEEANRKKNRVIPINNSNP